MSTLEKAWGPMLKVAAPLSRKAVEFLVKMHLTGDPKILRSSMDIQTGLALANSGFVKIEDKDGKKYAVLVKDQKKPTLADMRGGYYGASDGMEGLKSALQEDPLAKKDMALRKAVAAADTALSKVHMLLEANYIWD